MKENGEKEKKRKKKGLWLVEAQWPIRLVTESYFSGLTHVARRFFSSPEFFLFLHKRLFFLAIYKRWSIHTTAILLIPYMPCECFYSHSKHAQTHTHTVEGVVHQKLVVDTYIRAKRESRVPLH